MKLAVLSEGKMKPFKLIVHNPTFSAEDLVINPKDFPSVRIRDIVEIFHPEDDNCRLLLQVTSLKEDFPQKDAISVKQTIASTFQLRTYADIHVRVVNPKDVALDSLELTFKDQYLGRSDMWRLKKNLENTCVYLNKKIEFCGIRCEVYELWAQGDRVACGAITEDTKIVFRSSTSQVYLFIQMSSEMWDTDINGDLYFEKAVNGFLTDLFAKWKKNGSSHEVTIVLFSRTFYEAQSIEEFPERMRGCLQQDYKGRFYEDFYRVAVQNERYDDWAVILVELKRLFNNYPASVLEYHQCVGTTIPKAVNSTAAQGNFLEVLNMSLNVFEKHYLDRSFDRTGQLSVVITPGVGVFEVDRELTNITKQRIIDNGVGSDLVCLGEQPLHAVPLFKFHNKNSLNAVDDYSMPHWINLSFYSSSKQVTYSNFVPRIKLPPMKVKTPKDTNKGNGLITRSKQVKHDDNTNFPALFDYDAYDAQVFKLPSAHISGTHHTHSLQRLPSRKKSDQPPQHYQSKHVPPYRKFSEADISLFQTDLNQSLKRSSAVSIPTYVPDQSPLSSSIGGLTSEAVKVHHTAPMDEWEEELSPPARAIVGSAGSPYSPQANKAYLLRPGRALINPFDPSHVTIKLTSNRRRWTHVFPLGPTGIFMQQHHYQAIPQGTNNSEFDRSKALTSPLGHEISSMVTEPRRRRSLLGHRASESEGDRDKENRLANTPHGIEIPCRSRNTPSRGSVHGGDLHPDRSLTLLWGATGEQEWTPALTTGVDWKSLTIPACLPLTTDYFPDRRSLQNDYVLSDYTLLPDDVNADIALQVGPSVKPLSPVEVFEELVSQRLQQGFQQIALPKPVAPSIAQVSSSPQYTPLHARSRTCTESEPSEEHLLSIGRIFHKVSLVGSTITVTCFRPRHPYPTLNIRYQYRFQAPDMDKYELSWVTFMSEKLESYNWNYLDHYICWRGQGDFVLLDSLKYWRFRMFLLPLKQQVTKRILEDESGRCDIYQPALLEDEMHTIDGFLKFLEVVNRIKKPFSNRKQRKSGTFVKPNLTRTGHSQTVVQGSSPSQFSGTSVQSTSSVKAFRDRGDSNRSMDRPRPRSGSKMIERVRSESGNGGRISPASDITDTKPISSSSLSLDAGTTETLTGNAPESSEESLLGSETHRLSTASPLVEIVEAMKQPHNEGLSFLSRQQGLSSMTFISAEAVAWLIEHVDGVSSPPIAMKILEKMLYEGLICHASGSRNHPLVYGFYLYYIVSADKDQQEDQPEFFGDISDFRKDWVEVAVKLESLPSSSFPTIPNHPTLTRILSNGSNAHSGTDSFYRRKSVYNEANLEVDLSDKVNRAEWGHFKYHYLFIPGIVFEIAVQWMVATSSIITELAQNWSRKANPCGFHLIPVPSDPFALPYSYKSDPLRGPIFIPLDTEALLEGAHIFVFQDITDEDHTEQLFQFQESIAQRFGFLPCLSEMGCADTENHYIHVSGYMFLMIPNRPKAAQGIHIPGRRISQKSQLNMPIVSSPHEEYITRHVMGKSSKRVFEESSSAECRVGFLWSWNYMLSKRWKTGTSGDEQLMNRMFKDFREFCQNSQNRLQDCWVQWQQDTLFPDK